MNFKNIFSRKNRILLGELVRTDFKIRYQASFLGYVWSILNPLLLFAVLYLVFANFLGVGRDIEHFPVYLLLGVVLWSFFTETTNGGLKSIVSRASLIRKISLPKYIIVISGTVSSLINLLINLAVVVVFMVFNGVEFTWQALLIFPFIIQLYILALGISFLLSALKISLYIPESM
jgi:ABC-2 type transport system permease protein